MIPEVDEKAVQHHMSIDIPQWQEGATNFTSGLLRLIQHSDPSNKRKIRQIFPNEVEAFDRWERIEWSKVRMPVTGSVVTAGVAFLDVKPGMKGVVYEGYDRTAFDNTEDNAGVSIIFETGSYDGFSRFDLDHLKIRHTGIVDHITSYYRFENVAVLAADFRKGRFDSVFEKEKH